jgi:hypothetical protein
MNRLYVRRFLNSPGYHGGAYVLAVVERIRPDDDLDRFADALEAEATVISERGRRRS